MRATEGVSECDLSPLAMEFVLFFRINDGSKQHNQTPQTKGLHKLETSETLIYFYCLFGTS